MSWNVFSLVLACATGWSLLVLGYLPVRSVRELAAEPIKAVGAWGVVAATAPPAIFHWYLIFAVVCMVAWTKIDRPAAKFWLAASAALGLSLGIIFPLETSFELLGLKNPLALGPLYLGGATTGLAYVAALLMRVEPNSPAARGCVRWLVISAVVWAALLLYALQRLASFPRPLVVNHNKHVLVTADLWMPLVPAGLLIIVALLAWNALRRNHLLQARALATAAALVAFATSLLAEFILRTAPPLIALRN